MKEQNVYSCHSKDITILVFTQTFLHEKEAFQYFSRANQICGINILYMPLLTKSNDILTIDTGTYVHIQRGMMFCSVLKFPNQSSRICYTHSTAQGTNSMELDRITESHILQDDIDSHLFDYLVASDTWCNEHNEFTKIVPFTRAKELLRLFLINRQEFFITPSFHCGEALYYEYRLRHQFPEFQPFWSAIAKRKDVSEKANSLSNRLVLFLMCLDNALIEGNKAQNNTTAMHLKYHISYFLLLSTGIFDNLAWLINDLYTLKIEEKDRKLIDFLKDSFLKAVKDKSEHLYNYLTEPLFSKQVKAVRELRDSIVHRNFIDTISSREKDNTINYLWIDKTAKDFLLEAGFENKRVVLSLEDKAAIEIVSFITYLQGIVTSIVNNCLRIVNDEFHNNSSSRNLAWKMYSFPTEPYVL